MAANVETMFSVREKPWHGLGRIVAEAPTSKEALKLAGLDWKVVQEPIYTELHRVVEGYKANVRDSDRKVLGVVSDRYKVVQNADAFSFTDELLGKGVRYETAGSLQEGKKVWLLARLPICASNVCGISPDNAIEIFSFLITATGCKKVSDKFVSGAPGLEGIGSSANVISSVFCETGRRFFLSVICSYVCLRIFLCQA